MRYLCVITDLWLHRIVRHSTSDRMKSRTSTR
jgi:hypothetical protein